MESVLVHNTVRKIREKRLMSKAELARSAGISALTVDRIEKGKKCRIETKRKIVLAFGYDLADKGLIFKNV
jgi:DNA-binding XRE family transcriptional regulator